MLHLVVTDEPESRTVESCHMTVELTDRDDMIGFEILHASAVLRWRGWRHHAPQNPPSREGSWRRVASLAPAVAFCCRGAVAVGRLAGLGVLAATVLTACATRPGPSLPPPATALATTDATESVYSAESARFSTATDRTEPQPVAVSLDAFEQQVLSWLDPTREPRIEWSKYVWRSDLIRALPFLRLAPARLVDEWPAGFRECRLEDMSDVLSIVVASTRGIDALTVVGGEPWIQEQAQPAAVSPDRSALWAVFDTVTGVRCAAQAVHPKYIDLTTLDELTAATVAVLPEARRTPTPMARAGPKASPTPTPILPTPDGCLTWASLPAALRATFTVYPLAPGSSWTWRLTQQNADVRWVAEVVTETIEAAWLEGQYAVVRSRVDVHAMTAHGNYQHDWLGDEPGTRIRYVGSGFIAATRADIDWGLTGGWPTPIPSSPFGADGVARDIHLGLLPEPGEIGTTRISAGPMSVTTPAGEFDDCWRLDHIGGASWGSARVFCSNVGIVQYSFGDCAMSHCSVAVAELIRWTRNALPEY